MAWAPCCVKLLSGECYRTSLMKSKMFQITNHYLSQYWSKPMSPYGCHGVHVFLTCMCRRGTSINGPFNHWRRSLITDWRNSYHHVICSLQCTVTTTQKPMMTSSNRNIFRATGSLCMEFVGHRWIPLTKPVTRIFDVFFICVWTNGWVNNRDAGDLGRHRAHYDVTVMQRRQISVRWVHYIGSFWPRYVDQ